MITFRIEAEYAHEVMPHIIHEIRKRGIHVAVTITERDPDYVWYMVNEYDEDHEGYIEDRLNDLPTANVTLY